MAVITEGQPLKALERRPLVRDFCVYCSLTYTDDTQVGETIVLLHNAGLSLIVSVELYNISLCYFMLLQQTK